jgi:hypothetical protein
MKDRVVLTLRLQSSWTALHFPNGFIFDTCDCVPGLSFLLQKTEN